MTNTRTPSSGRLFVVATPIGNLSDMTAHAISCLKSVDIIACEDTRTSSKLLNHFGITTKTWAYHDHNADTQTQKLLERLQMGQTVALISDAGTPLISDPGFRLVQACHQAGICVSPVAGASAVIAALSVAGLPSDKFYFYGFLPAKSVARQNELKAVSTLPCTLIFYEAPHRIVACVADMLTVLGNRSVTFCRELTKTFETVHHTDLAGLLALIQNDSNQQKGEMVLVVAGATEQLSGVGDNDEVLMALLQELPLKKAVMVAAKLTGAKKNTLYDRALLLKDGLG